MKKALSILLLVGLGVSLLLSGCGSKEPSQETSTSTSTTVSTSVVASVEEAAPAAKTSPYDGIKKTTLHTAIVKEKYTSLESTNGTPDATITIYDDDSVVLDYKGLSLTGFIDRGSVFCYGVEPLTESYASSSFYFSSSRFDGNEFPLESMYDIVPHITYGEKGIYAPILLTGDYGDVGITFDGDYFSTYTHPEEYYSVYVDRIFEDGEAYKINDATALKKAYISFEGENGYATLDPANLTFDGITDNGVLVYTYSCDNPEVDSYNYNYGDGIYEYDELSEEEYNERKQRAIAEYSSYRYYTGAGLFEGYAVLLDESFGEILLYDLNREAIYASGYYSNTDEKYTYSISGPDGFQDGTLEIDMDYDVVNAFFDWN